MSATGALSEGTNRGPGLVERSRRPGPITRVVAVWRYRELLRNLVRKELKVKYKNSALGFVWTLLNPLLYLVVFSVVFQVILETERPRLRHLLPVRPAGLEPLLHGRGGGPAVDRRQRHARPEGLVPPRDPARWPRSAASLVHFLLQLIVLLGAAGGLPPGAGMGVISSLIVPALVVLLLLACGLRDRPERGQRLPARHPAPARARRCWRGSGCRPIVYPYRLVADRLGDEAPGCSCSTRCWPVVLTFQRALYNPVDRLTSYRSDVGPLAGTSATSGSWASAPVLLLLVRPALFGRLEDNLAEEI